MDHIFRNCIVALKLMLTLPPRSIVRMSSCFRFGCTNGCEQERSSEPELAQNAAPQQKSSR